MEKFLQINPLLDLYGALFTQKQLEILKAYYEDDFSMVEISESFDISRQAVNDALKKGEKKLMKYEEKIGFLEYMKKTSSTMQEISEILKKLSENKTHLFSKEELQKLNELINKLEGGVYNGI